PTLGRLLSVEGKDPGSQQDRIEALETSRPRSERLATLVRHHIDLPDLDVGLARRLGLRLDALLNCCAILDVSQDESLDIEICYQPGNPGAKRAVCAGDQDRLTLEGFRGGGELGILLLL